MRCEQHGLTAGPSGQCVVCLREERSTLARRARWLSGAFVATVLLVCGAVMAARWHGSEPIVPAAPIPPTVPVAAERVTTASPSETAPAEVAAAPSAEAAPVPSVVVIEAVDAGSVAPAAAPVASARVPDEREVQAALRATPVLMFSTGWCPHCERARRFFRANGIQVVDRDIEADPAALQEMRRRTAQKGVPLIVVDGQQQPSGFSEDRVRDAVALSVERRLGVSGLKLRAVAN